MSAGSSVFFRPSPEAHSEGLFFGPSIFSGSCKVRHCPQSARGFAAVDTPRKGDFEAFYLADTPETALYETEAIFRVSGVVVGVRQPPRVMLSLDCELQHVVDLRESPVLQSLGLTINDLKQPWKLSQAEERPVLTQRIGSAARAVDIEGLLAPSARVDTGTNLVIFPDRLRGGSRVELYVGNEPTIPRYTLQGRYTAGKA